MSLGQFGVIWVPRIKCIMWGFNCVNKVGLSSIYVYQFNIIFYDNNNIKIFTGQRSRKTNPNQNLLMEGVERLIEAGGVAGVGVVEEVNQMSSNHILYLNKGLRRSWFDPQGVCIIIHVYYFLWICCLKTYCKTQKFCPTFISPTRGKLRFRPVLNSSSYYTV